MEIKQRVWDERKRITLKDVAEAAGASQSAASVVLNGAQSGTRVSDDKRVALLSAAERLGYFPNAAGRALATGLTKRIGIYSGFSQMDSRNIFYAELLGGVLEAAPKYENNTMLHTSGRGDRFLLELLSSRAIDGLIVYASQNDPIVPLLGELRVPAVAVADRIDSIPSIVVDDAAGGALQCRHLAALGHKRVLLVQDPTRVRSSPIDRIEGFKTAAAQAGVQYVETFEKHYENDPLDADEIRLLTEGDDRATAVVAWSDYVAERICDMLVLLGAKIPQQVAVIGFDGITQRYLPRHRLTTIYAPWAGVGAAAVGVLMALIKGESVPDVTVLPIEFTRGDTT